MGAVIEDEAASRMAAATYRRREVTGDANAPGVGRAWGVPASTGTAVPGGGDPCRHPRCKRSVAVSWRSGAMTGRGVRGAAAQPGGRGGERSSWAAGQRLVWRVTERHGLVGAM